MRDLLAYIRWRWAWWRWFYEPPTASNKKLRKFLPHGPERRKTLRILHERWKAREPKLEDFK